MTLLPVSVLGAVGCGVSAARLGRVAGESRATTFTRGALGAFAAIVLVEELLGACGLLHAGAIALALGAGCLLLALVARRAPPVEAPPPARAWTPLELGLLAALLAALALRAWDALARTTFLYDALSYHLHAPATWLHDGRLSIVAAVFGDPAPAYAPSNVELLFLFLLAPTRSAALAQAGQAPLAALACAAIAATVREAGGPRAAALAAALAFLLVPEVWQQATSAMTDVGAAAFFLAALPFLLRLARRRVLGELARGDGVSDAGSLGLAVGLCAGAKVVGAVFVMPLVGVAVALCARARRPARQTATLLVGAAATGAFFYVRNLVVAGNPLYPLAVKVGAATLWPGVYDAAMLRSSAYHVASAELAELGRLLLEPGLAFALGGGLALTLGARRAPAWMLLAVALVGLFWLVVPYQESRFLFPLWGVVTIATAAFGRAETENAAAVWTWTPLTLVVLGSVVEQPTAERWAVLGAGAAVAAGSSWSRPWRERRAASGARSRAAAVAVAVLVAVALELAPVRAPAYALGDELDDAWAWFGANVHRGRVAYTGNNLAFPLTGDGLSNDVRYINVAGPPGALLHDFARVARAAPAGPEPAPYREGARYEAWLANLRVARRDVLFVAALDPAVRRTIAADDDGFPVERAWADAHAGVFTLRFASAAARVYGVSP